MAYVGVVAPANETVICDPPTSRPEVIHNRPIIAN